MRSRIVLLSLALAVTSGLAASDPSPLPGPAFPVPATPSALKADCDRHLATARRAVSRIERRPADAAWLAAADERAQPELDGALRIELLGRAASLATLLRIHVELQGCERVGAERALNLAEELAHNDLAGRDPDAPLPPGPRAGSSRQSSGWRTHVRSLSSWLQSG